MTQPPEENLDPDDWAALQALGHQMVDDIFDYLRTVRERPAWQPLPEETKEALRQPVPHQGQPPDTIYQEFIEHVLPYPTGNIHPRFWGWVMGTGTPTGVLAEMLAAAMNPNNGGGDQAGNYIEHQVLNWCKEMFDYPAEASGLLTSGGSMANLVGLTVARNSQARFDIRAQGLQTISRKMTLYASTEAHSSIQKAVELLGLGHEALRMIPVNDAFEIEIAALEEALARDRDKGYEPFCVVGNVGTVNSGAIDDLAALVAICQREALWLHVDGAFGALAYLSPRRPEVLGSLPLADSLAFDLHKWMYMPFEIGCALIRQEKAHRETFSLTPDYLTHANRGPAGGPNWLSDYGLQLSRGFRALKAWFSIKEHGLDKYGRLIQQNIDQAQYLRHLVEEADDLELLAPVPLNLVCFRFKAELSAGDLNELNQELLLRLQESGVAVPSGTMLNGRYALRTAITNHRSRREDFDILVDKVRSLGHELLNLE